MLASRLKRLVVALLRRSPLRVEQARKLARTLSPDDTILLDFPVHPRPRWTLENPHPQLHDLLNRDRERFAGRLRSYLAFQTQLEAIRNGRAGASPEEPVWRNGWMPPLDGVALYAEVAMGRPAVFMEVGSGNSTKFVRRAIRDHGPASRIVSIDPQPREEVDRICDTVIRQPVEDVSLDVFDTLKAGDIFYVDNSHRSFMNSDVTTVFLDILPRLRPGVLVGIHDITLPYDYPEDWVDRYYSEQYLLACYLLARGSLLRIEMPCYFASFDNVLSAILRPLWKAEALKDAGTHGCSFWLSVL